MQTVLLSQIQEAAQYVKSQTTVQPRIGIILGTGLGALAAELTVETELAYEQIPHFPLATVEFHTGRLLLGTLAGQPVVVMQGRFHFYEGYSMQQVTFPVRVLRELGISTLLVSNASGGLNPDFAISDLMVIDDHISLLMPQNPLTGKHYAQFGDRFPDMSAPYDADLIRLSLSLGDELGIALKRGTYIFASGPQLETKAEYRMLRQWGADAVGMSTVPEVIVAHQMGLRVFGISVVTDLGIPETLERADIARIIAAAAAAEPNLTRLMKALIERLDG